MSKPNQGAGELRAAQQRELAALRDRVSELEALLGEETETQRWRGAGYYTAYYATAGFVLGMISAAVSLLCNVAGSWVYAQVTGNQQHPLRLIQVYLTFPLGEQALQMQGGLALALGCCLYLATGTLYGMLFHLVLTRFWPQASFGRRLVVVSVMSLALWLINFGLLAQVQPALFGGNWIVERVPWWVAALTHLVFGWTMVLLYPWGIYQPYQPTTEEA